MTSQVPAVVGPRAEGVTELELDGQVCLYSPAGAQVLILNATASDVWHLADGQQTVDDIVQTLARAYRVTAAEVRDDVLQTLAQFQRAGVIASPSA
ncbi:MAG TPA: PqqD family protein [Angustibacter sp.]|nr:PqqD family protein [Angustibacter sp.]